jgi:hypothetical protein
MIRLDNDWRFINRCLKWNALKGRFLNMSDKAVKADKTVKKEPEVVEQKEIVFLCKFCGETKPVVELVIMQQFFPHIAACKACAKATRNAPGTV